MRAEVTKEWQADESRYNMDKVDPDHIDKRKSGCRLASASE